MIEQDWKKRYIHERDYRDSQLESLDLPPIQDEKFGVLKGWPKAALRRFNGKRFWPIMNAKGHTSCSFEDCDCRRRA